MPPASSLGIVILAAGKGTRMKSAIPKVLHPLAAKPLLHHVLDSTHTLNAEALWVIYGYQGDEVRKKTQTSYPHIAWIEQTEQKGTGHAVQQILPFCKNVDHVLVLYGDVPLLGHPNCHSDTLVRLMQADRSIPLHILTVVLENPTGYGRIVRDSSGNILRIVEEKDATPEQKKIREVNTGVMLVKRELLEDVLPKLQPNNAQGELYLTDIVQAAAEKNLSIASVHPSYEWETWGVNSPEQLAILERTLQQRLAIDCLQRGMRIADPARFDVRGTLEFGQDVAVDINVCFEGKVKLGNRVVIGPNVVIRNSSIGDDTVIEAFSHIDETQLADHCLIGPYARLRPGTTADSGAKVGNFVETKKTHIGTHSKINHLSYVGDANLGKDVNIGAGTITCNYDGVNKHITQIKDGAFIGSNSSLIAPVIIGENATIGAGSTITKEAPAEALTLTRAPQKTLSHWRRPSKRDKKS